jgi:GTP-binding protein
LAIKRADVALLLVDATSGVTAQDAHIAGFILEEWKSVVVVVNKWDLIEKDTHTMHEFTTRLRYELKFMDYVPLLFISAKTGQRVHRVLPLALQVQDERLVKLSTSQLNKVLQNAQDRHPAPTFSGLQLRIYYATQVRSDPPTFMLYVNNPKSAHFSYLRYLENQLREYYPFIGTPIRLVLKPRQ